jgi:hypothetical protein
MPVYRLQFTAESCLTSAADIAVPYAGVNVTFYCRMFPIIRPGSIVQIDQNQRKVLPRGWKDEDDGPIYFVELRGGFLCSWCELNEGYLSAVPHPKIENARCCGFPILGKPRSSEESSV